MMVVLSLGYLGPRLGAVAGTGAGAGLVALQAEGELDGGDGVLFG